MGFLGSIAFGGWHCSMQLVCAVEAGSHLGNRLVDRRNLAGRHILVAHRSLVVVDIRLVVGNLLADLENLPADHTVGNHLVEGILQAVRHILVVLDILVVRRKPAVLDSLAGPVVGTIQAGIDLAVGILPKVGIIRVDIGLNA